MNNSNKSRKTILLSLHIVFCVMILLVPLFIMYRNDGGKSNIFYFTYLARISVLILIFYINYLYLIDKLLFTKKFVSYFAINLVLTAVLVYIQNFFTDIIWSGIFEIPPPFKKGPHPPNEMKIIGDCTSMIFFIAMGVALKATMRWHQDSVNLESIKATQLEADLRNLRSQLNPHFLFNTLNNIYSLIAIDTQKAQESVHRLSHLLRYISYENDDKFVPIDKELEFTRNYIDLMALRLSPNVKLDVSIQNNGSQQEIASLMFITLIENAFKHGITNDKGSFIDVKIYVDKDKGVLCTVENSVKEQTVDIEANNAGIGLTNLRKRLHLLYPGNHIFDIKKESDRFYVLLSIDFSKNKTIKE